MIENCSDRTASARKRVLCLLISALAGAGGIQPALTSRAQAGLFLLSAPAGLVLRVQSGGRAQILLQISNGAHARIQSLGTTITYGDCLPVGQTQCPFEIDGNVSATSMQLGDIVTATHTIEMPMLDAPSSVTRTFTITAVGQVLDQKIQSNGIVITVIGDSAKPKRAYLPAIARAFETGAEAEPNNEFGQANPLPSGAPMSGRLNDAYDVFTLTLNQPGAIDLALQALPPQFNGKVQMQLYYQNSTQRVATVSSPPYTINYSAQAGAYFVVIFTDPSLIDPAAAYVLRGAYAR